MKIEAFTIREIQMPLVHFFETSFGRTYERRIILTHVRDEDGASGWSEAGRINIPPVCPRLLEALRQGQFTTAPPPAQHWNNILFGGVEYQLRPDETGREYPKCPS